MEIWGKPLRKKYTENIRRNIDVKRLIFLVQRYFEATYV